MEQGPAYYEKKVGCFLKVLIGLIVFVALLVWVYNMNFDLKF